MKAADFAEPLEMLDATHVRWRGRTCVYFGGCDYLRLSIHPRVRRVMERIPVNVAASRTTTGNHPIYGEVELAIAKYFQAPTATLCSNGYLTSIAVAQALRGEVDTVLIDERAHGCLRDAARLLGCRIREFRHRDADDLKRKLGKGRLLLMTDGVFAANGAIAPLKDYLRVLPRSAKLLVDDAHAAGVLGECGRGTWERLGISRDRLIQTVTFSKAFGVYGGAILGSKSMRSRLVKSGALVGNTPLPPMLAAGIRESLKLAISARRRRLFRNASRLRKGLEFPVLAFESDSPRRLSERLVRAGIHPPFIRYPGGAAKGFFRFAVSSEHKAEQLRDLVAVLDDFGQ